MVWFPGSKNSTTAVRDTMGLLSRNLLLGIGPGLQPLALPTAPALGILSTPYLGMGPGEGTWGGPVTEPISRLFPIVARQYRANARFAAWPQ